MTVRCVRGAVIVSAASWGVWLGGCASDAGAFDDRGLRASERYVAGAGDDGAPASSEGAPRERPAALLGGRPITWDDLTPRMAEMSGRRALDELVLERLLTQACVTAGVAVAPAAVDAEGELLIATYMAQDPSIDRARAEALVGEVKAARGLGRVRFAALLRRHAMLRALVRDEVVLDDAALARAYELRYGPLYRARLIVAPSRSEADAAIRELRAGRDFGEVAARRSTDPSAARGGVIDAISPADPSWRPAVRDAVTGLSPGQVSAPIGVDEGYAILRLDGVDRRGGPPAAQVREVLERDERLRQERRLMDRLARSLLAGADLAVLDATLE